MARMKALRAHEPGGPEALVYEETAVPVPARGEVLVAPHAAAITFAEVTWDETWSHLPTTPSHEFSGVVAALGEGVTAFEPGAEVYGLVPFDRNGAAAEFVAVPQDALAPRPMSVSHVEASAVPLAALTAWQALVDHAGMKSGDDVLIHGGQAALGRTPCRSPLRAEDT